ncbi:extracellular solute-binding protein [Halobacteriaceae archaeon GCM10025711]
MKRNGAGDRRRLARRRFLATAGAAATLGLAGCTSLPGFGGDDQANSVTPADFQGSGPLVAGRPAPGGTSMDEMPDLSGELTVYLGGGEGGRYLDLLRLIQQKYDGFTFRLKQDSSSSLANTIVEETGGGTSPADVFISIDAGSVGAVTAAGATTSLPANVLDPVRDAFQDSNGRWVGLEGRARTIPYNSAQLSASDVPASIDAVPSTQALADAVGWAPTYGAFQSFVTAMRLLEGEQATREWLQTMVDLGVTEYRDEFLTTNAVADGEVLAGFANHYYALRVQARRPDAPVEIAFTKGDAGALVNVSAGAVIQDTESPDLAANFIRHLLSAEAQEFFATVTYGYPMIPDVQPVGGLPTIDDLNPPDLDLTELSDIQPTLDLMREVGVL